MSITPSQTKELQKRVRGLVSTSESIRKYFSTDGSIFTIMPDAVVYPKNSEDVAGTVKYISEQRAKGKEINIVGRGKGTDQGGGSLGDGAMVVFPAHMNKVLKLAKDAVTIQPGIIYGDLQKILHMHHRFLPPYPSSINFSTVGGGIANNVCGEKTLKYGSMSDWVQSLKVVLSDGSVIETRRLNSRELNKKKGLMTLEGEIYRRVDSLIIDNSALIRQSQPNTSKNSAGYALSKVKGRDGSFDLSKLIVGSQGTLGLVTEATLKTAEYNPDTTLIVGYFDDLEKAGAAVLQLQKLKPSAMEIVDIHLLDFVRKNKPETLEGLMPEDLPKIVVLIEFDNSSSLSQRILSRRAGRILNKFAAAQKLSTKKAEQERLWEIRRSAAAVIWMVHGKEKALPIIEDGVVPIEKLPEFLEQTYKLLKKHKLEIAVWGHAGNANFHMQPFMDLSKTKDRKKVFALMDDFYEMVIKMGGSTCGEHNDGLLRAPYLEKLYGKEMYKLFKNVKHIFDPNGVFNPRIKLDVSKKDLEPLLRQEYSMEHLYDHMPHT